MEVGHNDLDRYAVPIDRLLPLLSDVRKTPNGWDARCPAHDDTRPSLGISIGADGTVLLKCRSQRCTVQQITTALGLKLSDLFPGNNSQFDNSRSPKLGPIVATYDYCDESGALVYQVTRHEPKAFRQRRPDGNGGWLWNLQGERRIPYRLPELLSDSSQPVFIVEGEKDADRLAALGLTATTNAQGAGKWGRLDAESVKSALADRDVVILPDNDKPGHQHAVEVAQRIHSYIRSIRIVSLPDLPVTGDLSDWLSAGGTREQLQAIVDTSPCWSLATDTAKENTDNSIQNERSGVPIHRTDLGNARRLIASHGSDLRYCHPWGKWLVWDGMRWREDVTAEAYRRAKATVIELFQRTTDEVQEIGKALECAAGNGARAELRSRLAEANKTLKFALACEDKKRLEAMLALAKSEPGVPILPDDLDRDLWLFNCVNGTVDLRTGMLRGHRPEDLITQLCPTSFDPAATCPIWLKFLTDIFPATSDAAEEPGNTLLIQFMQSLLGRCLTGDVSEHIAAIFWGGGANGKTTLIEGVKRTIGADYAKSAPASLLMAARGERHPTEVAMLFRIRLIVCAESEEDGRLNETRIKALTGGDRITARRMREDFWEFAPTHKVFLCTNHRPRVTGTDEGIWRRIRLVPFTVQFWNPDESAKPSDERPERLRQDKQLPAKLAAESPGILAWLVRGCLDWQRSGLGMPPEVTDATAEYRAAEDVIGEFIADRCATGPGEYKVRFSDLYAAFSKWSDAAGEQRTLSRKAFGAELKARRFEDYKSNGRWYRGIALPNDSEQWND